MNGNIDMHDDDGYPTEEFLKWIENYDIIKNDVYELINVIMLAWNHGDLGYKLTRTYNKYRKLELHTLGWSGNESIIRALERNELFFLAYWRISEVGGHFYFRIPTK
jgi:hypothetical protein